MANGDTVASGNIKLGVDTTPMEQGLAAAQGKAVESAKQTEAAVQDAREKVKQERAARMAAEDAARQAQAAAVSAKAADAAGDAADKATSKFQRFKLAVDGIAGGFRGAVSAVTGVIGAFTGVLAVVGLVTTAFLAVADALLSQSRAAKQARKDLEDLTQQSLKLAEKRLQQDTRDPEGDKLREEYRIRWEEEEKLFYQRQVNARKLPKGAERGDAIREIDAERLARKEALESELKARLEASYRLFVLNQNLADQAAKDAAAAELKAKQDADEALQEERKRDMEELIGYWTDIQNKADADRAAFQRDLMRQQQEQLAQLRNDINALYSSGNLEVGIGRVASLLETLIAKTEGRR